LVMFPPTNQTMHAVKASYNHLSSQRTQLYGNLWFNESPDTKELNWEEMVIPSLGKINENNFFNSRIKRMPSKFKNLFSKITNPQNNYSSIRNKKH